MEGEVHKLLLNGMPFGEFIVFYVFALAGALSFFLFSLYKAIKTDLRTPNWFSWKHFSMGAIRVTLSVLLLALSIIFWKQISMVIFAVEEPVTLNGWSSFMLGTLIDRLLEAVLGGGKGAGKFIMKRKP